MTSESARLVRESWGQLASRGDLMAVVFCGRLFELEPGLRPMFENTDFHEQRAKLMAMLDALVRTADQPDALIRESALLGRSHVAMRLTSRHFEVMGEALLFTLDRMLGLTLTVEMRTAWGELYALVASVMRRAAGRASGGLAETPYLPPPTTPDSFPAC